MADLKRSIALLLCLAPVIALSGCPGFQQAVDIGDNPDWPRSAAGFDRAFVTVGMSDITESSVAYNMLTPEAQIAATFFVGDVAAYPGVHRKGMPVHDIYEAHKAAIEQQHPGAELLSEDIVNITKNGRDYSVLRADYRFDGDFMQRRQPVYSVLMVWRHKDNLVRLRSTMPFDQRFLAESNNLNLLNAVNWTVDLRPPKARPPS